MKARKQKHSCIMDTMTGKKVKLKRAYRKSRISGSAILLMAFVLFVVCARMYGCARREREMREAESQTVSAPYIEHDYDFSNLQWNGWLVSYEDENYTSRQGIDVSMHQEEIDLAAVKAEGIDFAFIRCGYRGYLYGDVWEDPYFHANMMGAIENDIDIGVYFFSQAINEEEAREEADFIIRILRGYEIDLPVVFDMETSVDGYPSRILEVDRFDRTVAAVTFLHHLQNAGYDVMVYNSSLLFDTIFMADYLQEFDIWVADYNYAPQYPYRFSIWQYTSDAYIDGIEGRTDMDIMFVPKEKKD